MLQSVDDVSCVFPGVQQGHQHRGKFVVADETGEQTDRFYILFAQREPEELGIEMPDTLTPHSPLRISAFLMPKEYF